MQYKRTKNIGVLVFINIDFIFSERSIIPKNTQLQKLNKV
ncbi:MAG: hypothetical protein ACI8YQ_000455 [Polaribacter sp.]|jgi:hypothetical protein